MPDIRLTQPRAGRIWLWVGLFAVIGLLAWASAFVVGDATDTSDRAVGARAGFGDLRAPVIPAQAAPFESLAPPATRDLGRLVHLTGVAQSAVRSNAVWVRTPNEYRIMVRFEPAPGPEALSRIGPGSSIRLDGYLAKISRAEFEVWMDTLRVAVPRPPPGRKFGDLPDPAFARVDSLFIKDFYVSVRPEALEARPAGRDTAGAAR